MKTFKKSFLPDIVKYNGEIYTLNLIVTNGMNISETNPKDVIKALKSTGKKGVLVQVFNKRLIGKLDIHNKPYSPEEYIFTNEL